MFQLEYYKLLVNSTYLYMVENNIKEPNYSQLSQILHCSRKTVAKEYQAFCNIEDWQNIFNIVNFYSDENINKYMRAIKILIDLNPNVITIDEAANLLGVTSKTLNNAGIKNSLIDKVEDFGCIYKIYWKEKLIYIGTTSEFRQKRSQHLRAIKNKTTNSQLYKYCADNNVDINDISIEPLLNYKDLVNPHKVELILIKEFKPIGNKIVC